MEEYWLWQPGWCLRNKGLCLILYLIITIILIIVLLANYWSIPHIFLYPLLTLSVSSLFTILAVGGGFFSKRTSLRIYRISTGFAFVSVGAISFEALYLMLANGDAHLLLHPLVLLLLIIGLVPLLIGIHRIYSGMKG